MKYGVNTWVWTSPLTTASLAALIPKIAAMGFDLVELPLEDLVNVDFEQAATIIGDHGLSPTTAAVIGADRDLIHPDRAIRESGMRYVREAIAAAATVGSPALAGPIYAAVGRTWQATPAERQRDLELLVGQLRQLAPIAADHGVTLCLEPLNRFETSFINTAEQVVEVVDRVDHPACGVLLDTFHMNIEEKSAADAIRLVGPRLKHFHTCENDRGTPGSGNVAWQEIAAAIAEIGYEGPAVIESFTADVKTIARAAAIWRPLAPSQDALAADGLAFLRQTFG